MKKVITFFVVLFIGIVNVQATDTLELCEYSEEYKAWLRLSDEEKASTIMPSMCKQDNHNINLLGSNDYSMDYFNLADSGKVLGVRDQAASDDCWAFASLASLESNLLMNNINTGFLSTAHLELMTQDSLYTPSFITFNRDFNSGGRMEFTTAYVLNYWGPVKESDMPFETVLNLIDNNTTVNQSDVTNKKAMVDVDDVFYLSNSQGICSNNTINTIKEYIVNYGALATSVYFNNAYVNGKYYYYNGSELSNHAVAIVGWDDNVEVTSFNNRATRKGAWIVKNSYGTSVGDGGYYYISYDDVNICTDAAGFYNASLDMSDEAYYYDDLGVNTILESPNNVNYLANYFTKKTSGEETIDKVTFATAIAGMDYTVYYADNINGNLENWQELASGTTNHVGYMSVDIDKDIKISDSYGIIVKFETDDTIDDNFYVAIEGLTEDNFYSSYEITNNVSRISFDGKDWMALEMDLGGDLGINVATQFGIRLYTSVSEDTSSNNNQNNVNNNTTPEINDSGNITVTNPNGSLSDIVGDTVPNDTPTDVVENPQTGVISGVSIVIVLAIIGVVIYYKKKNKIFKI